jgi:phosphohistidine swiveling domain-containing protein
VTSTNIAKISAYPFPGTDDAPVAQVGGKGWSLIRMSAAGMPVPPGFVLPAQFFTPWINRLKEGEAWKSFLTADASSLQASCNGLKNEAQAFTYTGEQEEVIQRILQSGAGELFAVRSSSPEEDLEGASFAGGYETILGVSKDTMHDAIKRAFASCLDHRVVIYKREHGFDANNPQIAIVIQKQIASDVAGVGFSLNPITNNYDEAVFNANWGQGETVVSGIVTPDTFVVDKVSKKVIERSAGKKETSIWLKPTGDTEEREDPRHDELTLSDRQLVELSKLIDSVCAVYGKPIDIEWAFEAGKLYLLQARPVTTYIPMPPDMETKLGERKRLYLDFTLCTQGLTKPMSPMGASVLRTVQKRVSKFAGVKLGKDVSHALGWIEAGRFYLNLSNVFNIAPKDKLAQLLSVMDPLAAQTIQELDAEPYKAAHTDKHFPWHLMLQVPQIGANILEARTRPEEASHHAEEKVDQFYREVHSIAEIDLPVAQMADKLLDLAIHEVFIHTVPLVITSRVALGQIKAMFPDLEESQFQKLERALPNNVTTEMGLELYEASLVLPADLNEDTFNERLQKRDLPPEFLEAWDEFIRHYGHRGLTEIDIASPRYRDDPSLLVDQMLMLKKSATEQDNPQQRFDRAGEERHKLLEELSTQLQDDPGQIKRLHSLFTVLEELGGFRETHKFCLIMVLDLVRQKLLKEGERLFSEGRLDSRDQIFDLTLDDYQKALSDRSLDLRRLCAANRELPDKLARVPQLPAIFDSRGKILRPAPRPAREGEVAGTAISPGIARGRIKVLHTCDEKPLERGEILVARATDPGWTPLFVNAGAVILEVGGLLQHGALVAREYGLPCVSGVANATSLWQDGTLVEVDGSAGIVKLITE